MMPHRLSHLAPALLSAAFALLLIQQPAVVAGEWDELTKESPWVFLGDSNTYAGGYVAAIDAAVQGDASLARKPFIVNLGMPSETASGLSEPDHPFPRPCIHERVDSVLDVVKPSVVFICYGMNDGIYAPLSEERMQAYRQGMQRLAEKIRKQGAKLICLTPPPFEVAPVAKQGKLGPTAEGNYAWFAPFENYDEVLAEQAKWCLKNEIKADQVIDLRTALVEYKQRLQQTDSDFAFSGDGVHFGTEAHDWLARTILKELGAPEAVQQHQLTEASRNRTMKRMHFLRDAYIEATGKNRPGLPEGLSIPEATQKADLLLESPR